MLNQRGFTLVELIVAIALAAIIFGAATTSLLKQQQSNRYSRALTDADAQLSASIGVLGEQLSSIDRGSDLVDGEARDTALQIRAPIASALACTSASAIVTVSGDTSVVPLSGMLSTPKLGDSLWWRADSTWHGALVTSVAGGSGSCTAPFAALDAQWRLGLSAPDTIPVGSMLRITRHTRYSLYHATDGTWQLGFRESSGIPARFAASQPVVGPLVPRAGLRRTGFRYFDDTHTELLPSAAGVPAPSVARVRVTVWSLLVGRRPGTDSLRADSIDIALLHAHGP